jgi:transposase
LPKIFEVQFIKSEETALTFDHVSIAQNCCLHVKLKTGSYKAPAIRCLEITKNNRKARRPVTDDDAPLKNPRLEAFEALRDHFLKELKRTGVTKQLLWQEYLIKHPDGFRYTQFYERLRRYEQSTDVSLHIAYKPGDTLMIDFAGDKLSYEDPITGALFHCTVLVCVLPFSG